MKRLTILLCGLVFVIGALAAPDAGAGWFKKKKKTQRTEKPEWMQKSQRFTDVPQMSFHSGVLQQQGRSGWQVGQVEVTFSKNCLITAGGEEVGYLSAGREVVVMGPRYGNTIVAWSATMSQPSFATGRSTRSDVKLKYSDTTRDCGEIISAPH